MSYFNNDEPNELFPIDSADTFAKCMIDRGCQIAFVAFSFEGLRHCLLAGVVADSPSEAFPMIGEYLSRNGSEAIETVFLMKHPDQVEMLKEDVAEDTARAKEIDEFKEWMESPPYEGETNGPNT